MVGRDIVYIRTEPMAQTITNKQINAPNFRCTIELIDGTTIMRCGLTVQHALANAVASYKTAAKAKSRKP